MSLASASWMISRSVMKVLKKDRIVLDISMHRESGYATSQLENRYSECAYRHMYRLGAEGCAQVLRYSGQELRHAAA